MKMTPLDRIEFLKKEMIRALNQQYVCTDCVEILTAFREIASEYEKEMHELEEEIKIENEQNDQP